VSEPTAARALSRNLRAGARLVFLRPVRPTDFVPTLGQIVLLAGIGFAVWTAFDWWGARPDPVFETYGLPMVAYVVFAAFLACVAVALASRRRTVLAILVVALAASVPFALPILEAVNWLGSAGSGGTLAGSLLAWVLGLLWGMRLLRVASDGLPWRAGLVGIVAVAAIAWSIDRLYVEPWLWYPADSYAEDDWDDAPDYETALFEQTQLIDAAASRLRAGESGKVELFYLGFAGYGDQGVFARDVRLGAESLARQYDLDGRVLELVNDDDDETRRPLATVPGLTRALADIAARMNVDEDILFLHLTSHGTENPEVVVRIGSLTLQQLTPGALADALAASGIRWRVILVSSCYSGGFMPALDDRNTVVITAASADRTSFGCSNDSEHTYFGEAYFRDALPASTDLIDAARKAIELVGKREAAEDLKPSHPQLYVGAAMRERIGALKGLTMPPGP
jgi:Peptidase C13 family